jgi:hypothetical protein
MTRRLQFSLGWGVFGAGFGGALGAAVCWFNGAELPFLAGTCLILAFLFGALGSFFGNGMTSFIFEVLSYLIP